MTNHSFAFPRRKQFDWYENEQKSVSQCQVISGNKIWTADTGNMLEINVSGV